MVERSVLVVNKDTPGNWWPIVLVKLVIFDDDDGDGGDGGDDDDSYSVSY